MSDCADDSDAKIHNLVTLGREKIDRALVNSRLRPIVFEVDGERFGVCHWCESPIKPGNLFCARDPRDEGMCCSESWDHDNKRRKDTGV